MVYIQVQVLVEHQWKDCSLFDAKQNTSTNLRKKNSEIASIYIIFISVAVIISHLVTYRHLNYKSTLQLKLQCRKSQPYRSQLTQSDITEFWWWNKNHFYFIIVFSTCQINSVSKNRNFYWKKDPLGRL